jgi:hypothetical protein
MTVPAVHSPEKCELDIAHPAPVAVVGVSWKTPHNFPVLDHLRHQLPNWAVLPAVCAETETKRNCPRRQPTN